MDTNSPTRDAQISSKEILRRTGISRATLNNYIKAGILPKPAVGRPQDGSTSAKKIGFFPYSALDRIEQVQHLKREGRSIEAIAELLGQGREGGLPGDRMGVSSPTREPAEERVRGILSHPGRLRLTIDEISFPAYLLNNEFEITWINREGELRIFKGSLKHEDSFETQNIFKLLFNWEYHIQVVNWKNLLMLHMAYAKVIKLSKTWITGLYRGISQKEIDLLEEIYDQVSPVGNETIRESYVSLLLRDGLSESFKMTSIFFREGVLFIYVPVELR